jgi:hypothetical protein
MAYLGVTDNKPIPPVGAIVARFPGPVTLDGSRRKKLAMLAIPSVLILLFAVMLVRPPVRLALDWPVTIFAWSTIALFGWLAIGAAILLRRPTWWCLLLDADGFEVYSVLLFRPVRLHWRDVSEFRIRYVYGTSQLYGGREMATFEVPGARYGGRGTRILPDSYGLSEEDLVWLMNEWRARALARLAEQER